MASGSKSSRSLGSSRSSRAKKINTLLILLTAVALVSVWVLLSEISYFDEFRDKPNQAKPSQARFSFQVNKTNCVTNKTVTEFSKVIRYLNKENIRVFPRNGFLLGIIRHGGLLPNEKADFDLAVISTDLENFTVGHPNKVSNFTVTLIKQQLVYKNWENKDPISGKRYPAYGVKYSGPDIGSESAWAFFPYHQGRLFYPHMTVGFNHKGSIKEMLRWNSEGANHRLLDTDELVNETNFADGKQIGTVYPADTFECMVERQFYFTEILVPCNYDVILTAHYGKNWNRVEKRSGYSSLVISDEEQEKITKNGPRPLCSE